jgi:trehalose 6-phosphate phosphatase
MVRPPMLSLSEWAFFLDLDGTLLDIAGSPDAVTVPAGLIDTLGPLRNHLSGALAIISGRSIKTIDRLLHPLLISAAGEHGAVLRFPDGDIADAGSDAVVPREWRKAIHMQAQNWPNTLVEEKPHGIAIHYRGNPTAAGEIGRFLETLTARDPSFVAMPAIMAFEIRHCSIDKGNALAVLMAQDLFRDRKPLFIGDDVTDEDAILAASQLGGTGFRVPDAFGGEPAQVRLWLSDLVADANRHPRQMSR